MAGMNRPEQANASFTPEIWVRIAKRFGLSKSERSFAELIFHGLLEKQASCKLEMAEGTGHSHVKKIYEKLRVRSRAEFSKKLIDAYLQMVKDDAKNPPPP